MERMSNNYVHGYAARENIRLQDQATTLVELLHADTRYPAGTRVLEAGCGVGAQTVPLARNSPFAEICSVDMSETSLLEAKRKAEAEGLTNVVFQHADILDLPAEPESFDHVFICFLLEHLSDPVAALRSLKCFLKRGGTITVIEGDHGSTYFHPDSEAARDAIQCLVELQRQTGGNANIGRTLHPLLKETGFACIKVSPRIVYVHSGKPEWVEGFTKKTFTAMVECIRKPAIQAGLISAQRFDDGVRALYRTAEPDGVFCYTFFKATALKQ
jgi:ubiquinone/menaquinone biosynthesis C-methylase UbiE